MVELTTKHNCKHPERARSRYPERLRARGLSKAPLMLPLATLRSRHLARIKEHGTPWPTDSGPTTLQFVTLEGVPYAQSSGHEQEEESWLSPCPSKTHSLT